MSTNADNNRPYQHLSDEELVEMMRKVERGEVVESLRVLARESNQRALAMMDVKVECNPNGCDGEALRIARGDFHPGAGNMTVTVEMPVLMAQGVRRAVVAGMLALRELYEANQPGLWDETTKGMIVSGRTDGATGEMIDAQVGAPSYLEFVRDEYSGLMQVVNPDTGEELDVPFQVAAQREMIQLTAIMEGLIGIVADKLGEAELESIDWDALDVAQIVGTGQNESTEGE